MSEQAKVVLMDQYAAAIPDMESPLFQLHKLEKNKKHIRKSNIQIKERALLGHLILRAKAGNKTLATAIKIATGMQMPERLSDTNSDQLSLRWLSPDEWLLICPLDQCFGLEEKLRENMSGHYSIVNVSGGQTIIEISGENATELLKKCTCYDVHASNFPVGKVVSTNFAKSQVIMCRVAENTWELVIRRSYAEYIYSWLNDVILTL